MNPTKYFLFFILFSLVCFDGYGQTELESRVITALLKSGNKLIPEYHTSKSKGRVKKFNRRQVPDLVLLSTTKSPLRDAEFDTSGMFQKKVLLNEDREMLKDFCLKNKITLKIQPVVGLEKQITYIGSPQLKKIFTKKDDWHTYYGNYGLKPFVNVSRPGFNEKKNKAFVYLTYSLGKNDGAGYYLVMKKFLGKWRIKGNMLVWVL